MEELTSPSSSSSPMKSTTRRFKQGLVKNYISRLAYKCAIPIHVFETDSFKLLLEACGQMGPRAQPPTRHEISNTLLKQEVDRTKGLIKRRKNEWKRNGCSIIINSLSGIKTKNLCVNSSLGSVFLSSKECSHETHIYEYIESCIQEIGQENVVQVVTDNASNNMEVAKLLKEKRPTIYWTSCATHTINLMLEEISNLSRFKKILDQAKALTMFLYLDHKKLSMMKSFTKKGHIVRPGVTRFASTFLTLQNLTKNKAEIMDMFSSTEWEECEFFKTFKGKIDKETVLDTKFWEGVTLCLKVLSPLVKVLQMVDGNKKSSMGFVYGEIMNARQGIIDALGNFKEDYEPIMEIISSNMKDRLDSHLHLTAYLLNPYYHYHDWHLKDDNIVMIAFNYCLDTIFHEDIDLQVNISLEFINYMDKVRMFRREIVSESCEVNDDKFDPANWWRTFGVETPHLKKFAIRILSLTVSASGCERNWNTFEEVIGKKRHRPDTQKLKKLDFVQFNANLMAKNKRRKKNMEVLLASDANAALEWIVDCNGDEVET